MLNKIKHYSLFFAATLNIIASAYFVYAETLRYSDTARAEVTATLGTWFAAVSVVLWVLFTVLYFVARSRKK